MFLRLSVLVLCLSLVSPLSARELRLAISDLLADFIATPLQTFGAENAIDLEIDRIGSLPALERLRADEIDMAIIALPENASAPAGAVRLYPLAYAVAVVAVKYSNPLDEISIEQLGGIFGANEEFSYTRWGDLGLPGWGNRSIKPFVGPAANSISLELFKFSALSQRQLKSSVVTVQDSEVEGLLRSDPASIAILSRVPQDSEIKTLMVSGKSDGAAYGPTADNVHYGDYPMRLAFHIVCHERDDARVQKIVRALLSDAIAEELQANHLLALPDTVRLQLTIDLDLAE